ncbi:hypothetical protein S7711_07633 [Stachybotrys chartarum IBT 7711]|uniref:Nap family protein n=1 Tax=Stachybotrys chartarum (strain CBS 109288 / IBT 7711) TaxID=1280523 RepID=A0A084ALJ7_STACB|nr:hypothetical protein S7711_07633 [Stachybotrys chartarum IBT 7711]KFA48127.1 hypothetical protein S40293_09289 [Stachybotrys chartarum IBT 40293]KFA75517.1 hypothetical protein S40288_01212 [Stachybotrys chartarum IBT 40288]
MSAEQLDNPVFYHQLEELEEEFEQVNLELLRQQDALNKNLYAKREKLAAQIPNFWPLVFEQAPPDIDEYVQPSDAMILATSLVNLSVERFELPDGDPRSLSFRFEFSENDFFEDKVLEKKFWWRRHQDGWAGLVSEPVAINWKKDQDVTGGMLDLVKKIWDEEQAGKAKDEETEAKRALKAQMEKTGLGGVSFFAWFGFCGRKVSAEDDKKAQELEQKKRKALREGKEVDVMDEDEEEDEDDDDDEYELEIFPTGDDLAVCIAEDLWHNALKYFTQAQEEDGLSDADFESDAEDKMEEDEADGGAPPNKKRKA